MPFVTRSTTDASSGLASSGFGRPSRHAGRLERVAAAATRGARLAGSGIAAGVLGAPRSSSADTHGTETGEEPTTTEAAPSTPAGDAAAGEAVFASAGCGGCHTLEAAGTSGKVGPNLDDAKPDEALVVERVTNGMGVMPSFVDQLSEKQIQDVAAYVADATQG